MGKFCCLGVVFWADFLMFYNTNKWFRLLLVGLEKSSGYGLAQIRIQERSDSERRLGWWPDTQSMCSIGDTFELARVCPGLTSPSIFLSSNKCIDLQEVTTKNKSNIVTQILTLVACPFSTITLIFLGTGYWRLLWKQQFHGALGACVSKCVWDKSCFPKDKANLENCWPFKKAEGQRYWQLSASVEHSQKGKRLNLHAKAKGER